MHAQRAERQRQHVQHAELAQPREQVVGVQHRDLGRVAQPRRAERADVGVGAHEAAVVALEAAQAADRLRRPRTVVVETRSNVPSPERTIRGFIRNGAIRSDTAIGPAPGPPPPWGCVNDLCRLKWTMSKPMSPGRTVAHDRVEVRAVVVERRPDRVDDLGDLLDVRVEDPQRVGVGQHQARDLVARLGPQVVEVDAAVGVRADLDDLAAGHRHRRRVRAVRGVGREDLAPVLAARLVVGPRQQHAGQLAVRPGARLQRDVRQARRSRPARARGSTSARAPPARRAAPGAGAAARGRAAPRRARAGAGCASSCTSRAGRSPSRDRSCAWRR